jgi:hypothetical protein
LFVDEAQILPGLYSVIRKRETAPISMRKRISALRRFGAVDLM